MRMMLAATGFAHGPESMAIVAATGCNTVYTSTYPYNPYLVPWTNSLFENAPAVALGVRAKWDQRGWQEKRLWVLGGDGAMYDIGFQSLSRMLASGMDIKVLVLDTQVYSNTGGQASTASFIAQDAKMAAVGSATPGKTERRKELGLLCLMHPEVFVAQTTAAHINHFYRAIMDANSSPAPRSSSPTPRASPSTAWATIGPRRRLGSPSTRAPSRSSSTTPGRASGSPSGCRSRATPTRRRIGTAARRPGKWWTSSPSPAPRVASRGSSMPRGVPPRRSSPPKPTAWPTGAGSRSCPDSADKTRQG